MAIYFPPPPVFVGGSQPFAASNDLPPSVANNVVNNPPFDLPDLRPVVLKAWEAQAPQPYVPGSGLVPRPIVQPGIISTQPPFSQAWLSQVVQAWQPSFVSSPLEQLPPSVTNNRVDQPPFGLPDPRPSLLRAWEPPAPQPYVPGEGSTSPQFVSPGTVVFVQPPYTQPWLATIINAWQPGPPQPVQLKPLSPFITNNVVNNPPFGIPDPRPTLLKAWEPGPPMPYSAGDGFQAPNLIQSGITIFVQPPFTPNWLATVVAAWQPGPPQPILPSRLPGILSNNVVNNPPFGLPDPRPLLLRSWEAPQPPPYVPGGGYQSGNLVQSGIVVFVQPPPSTGWLLNVLQAWQPAAPQPQQLGAMSPGIPGQSVDRPPIPSRAGLASVTATAWLPPAPQPRLRGPVAAIIPPPPVNNPPFGVPRVADRVICAAWEPGPPQPVQHQVVGWALSQQFFYGNVRVFHVDARGRIWKISR